MNAPDLILHRGLITTLGSHCAVHGHDHARAWLDSTPVLDLKSFWGALVCACWAV